MALVVDVFPAFTLFGVKNHRFKFIHEGIYHGQRLAEVLGFIHFLELINLLIWNEGETTQRVENVDRLEAVFLTQISIQVTYVHQSGALTLIQVILQFKAASGRADEAFVIITRKHQHIFRIEARNFAHGLHKVMDRHKPSASHINTVKDVVGQDGLQRLKVTVAPKLEHIKGQGNKCVVALGMHLLAEEMHQLVLTSRDFIHIGGHVTDFAFGTDFIEVNGEDTRQLLYLLIIRCDVGVQNLGDFALEKVSVA